MRTPSLAVTRGPANSRRTPAWTAALRRLAGDASGQDVIEYGLLSAFFGIVAIAAWMLMQNNLGAAYRAYDTGVQSIWESPNPGGA
jgi:Flp pilus assembly pilin Flp